MKKYFLKTTITLLCFSLIFTLCLFTPTISAKTIYKTLAFDKKIEKMENFRSGEMKNLKIVEKNGKTEISLLANENGEYISPIVKAPFEALHIGLHWNEELFDGAFIEAYIRTSNDGKNFSKWIKVNAERDAGRDGIKKNETFSSLIGTKKAAFAQAKIEFIAEKGVSPKLKTLTFTFLNSGEESSQVVKKLSFIPRSIAEDVGTQKISPNGYTINVISREDWGADESYRNATDGNEEWSRSYHGTRKLIIHHTDTLNDVEDLETNKATIRSIYYYHAVTQGWGDIGYNALVDATGNIYEGRYGTHGENHTRSEPSEDQIMVLDIEGAHAASYNSGSFGVSALGNFENSEISDVQLLGIKKVLAFVADSRGIDPSATSDFLRYDDKWHYNLDNVIGHSDVGATACPGIFLHNQLGDIKSYIIDEIALPNIALSTTNNIESGTITFDWSLQEAVKYQCILEKIIKMPENQLWETAWFNLGNIEMFSTINNSITFQSNDLEHGANYVFYIRALDGNDNIISSVAHSNFKNEYSVIVDNLDDNTISVPGEWTSSTNVAGFYATNYFVNGRGNGNETFEWQANLVSDGNYNVYVWYTSGLDRARNAPYTITYQDTDGLNLYKTILVDQKINGGKWVLIDTLYFKAGNASIKLSDNTNRYVVADAVKFTLSQATENQSPIANAGIDQVSIDSDDNGFELITLDGSNSYDSDGTISSFVWTEGGTLLGDGDKIDYNFAIGVHNVTLTVTDNNGLTNTDTVTITITEVLDGTMHVSDITMSTSKIKLNGWYTYATAIITITDNNGIAVENANVYGDWSGLTNDSDAGLTNSSGEVILTSDSIRNFDGTFTFTVADVVFSGLDYSPLNNKETSDSISAN